jgi:hypothetical protein
MFVASNAHCFTDYVQNGLYAIVCIFFRPLTPPTIYSGFRPPKIAYELSSILGPAILKLIKALSIIPCLLRFQT